jgi:putative ABC transport system permease protein
MKKLGVTHLGQTVEIRNIRARVMGFTEGIRTFTTSPLIFTS